MYYSEKLDNVTEKALAYITGVLKKRGSDYQLIDPTSYEEGLEDEVY